MIPTVCILCSSDLVMCIFRKYSHLSASLFVVGSLIQPSCVSVHLSFTSMLETGEQPEWFCPLEHDTHSSSLTCWVCLFQPYETVRVKLSICCCACGSVPGVSLMGAVILWRIHRLPSNCFWLRNFRCVFNTCCV